MAHAENTNQIESKETTKKEPRRIRPVSAEEINAINAARSGFATWADDILLREDETAAVTGMSRSWLKQERNKDKGDKGPRFTIAGGCIRYSVGDVRQWLRDQTEGASEPSQRGRAPRKNA